jgi:hypothetical protein
MRECAVLFLTDSFILFCHPIERERERGVEKSGKVYYNGMRIYIPLCPRSSSVVTKLISSKYITLHKVINYFYVHFVKYSHMKIILNENLTDLNYLFQSGITFKMNIKNIRAFYFHTVLMQKLNSIYMYFSKKIMKVLIYNVVYNLFIIMLGGSEITGFRDSMWHLRGLKCFTSI